MRISDWSSDVCSSDLAETDQLPGHFTGRVIARIRRIGEHTGGTERQHALGLCRRQRVADVDEFARCACLQIFAEFAWLTTEQLGYRIDIAWCIEQRLWHRPDRKSTRLNSSH